MHGTEGRERARQAVSEAAAGSTPAERGSAPQLGGGLMDKLRIALFCGALALASADIKPGDFLAVTSMKRDDGTLTAFEVRRFPKPLNPGHRPLDGRSDQTMTNATVAATVQSASGRELTLTYEGGSQKVVVPEGASISVLVPGDRSQLVPGAAVNLTAAPGAGGKLTAQRIQVSPVK